MKPHTTHRRTTPRLTRRQLGATLVEAAATTMVVGVVSGLVAPSFKQALERHHLEGAAAQLETDLQLARATAVARNSGLRVSFESAEDGRSCYVIHTGASGDCACTGAPAGQAAVCTNGAEALRSVHFATGTPVGVRSNSRSILFDPDKGTVTPTATVRVQAAGGAAIHQIISVMGRVRSCSPAPVVHGYRPC